MVDMKIEVRVPVAKSDPERMLVFGFANVSVTRDGEVVTDLHNDEIPPDVLEKAAYNFVLRYREGGLEHEKMGVSRLVESCFITPEKLAAMGVKDTEFNGASWWVGFKVDEPEVWAAVKSGELPMFSIGGEGSYEEVAE